MVYVKHYFSNAFVILLIKECMHRKPMRYFKRRVFRRNRTVQNLLLSTTFCTLSVNGDLPIKVASPLYQFSSFNYSLHRPLCL